MRQLVGGVFAASILLQGSFLIGTQDFGRWAMPFGFCDIKRVEPPISNVRKRKKNRNLTDSLKQSSRIRRSQLPRLPVDIHEPAKPPPQRIYFYRHYNHSHLKPHYNHRHPRTTQSPQNQPATHRHWLPCWENQPSPLA